jgi:lipopolysaccharide transport system ATP-binding protein
MSSETAIEARGLGKAYRLYTRKRDRLLQVLSRDPSKFYREHWALHPIDLAVERGEAVAIIGRNGSGKSTFLQLVCGMLEPTCGEVTVRGRVAPLLELGAGFHPDFTGRENVHLSGAILGLSRAEIDSRFDAIADFAEIGEFLDQPVKRYSTGMTARLAFAVAAHVDADILVVDEILAVGDAGFTAKCMRYIRRFRERGTLFFVSHDISAVLSLCDRAVWLDSGRVRSIGPAKEVCHAYEASLQIRDDVDAAFRSGGSAHDDSASNHATIDEREERLQDSVHRNELQLFEFDPDAEHFGYGSAVIEHVEMLDSKGQPAGVLDGGEIVELVIHARSREDIDQPIVGFYLKNALGQALFGDNTYLTCLDRPARLAAGKPLEARFRFQMPYLPAGDFSIAVAIADGTQQDHTQHHWLEAALFFKVQNTHVGRGLIGIPMISIEMKT